MCKELSVSSGGAGQGAVKCLDGLGVALQEIIRHAQVQSCPSVGAVEAERPFEPGHGIGGFACKYQNDPAISIAIGIARIDLERAVDFPQCKIIMSSEEMDNCEQAVRAGRGRVECQCLLHQPLGTLNLFIRKFRPSGNSGVEIGTAEGRIGGSVIRDEVDCAMNDLRRCVVLLERSY